MNRTQYSRWTGNNIRNIFFIPIFFRIWKHIERIVAFPHGEIKHFVMTKINTDTRRTTFQRQRQQQLHSRDLAYSVSTLKNMSKAKLACACIGSELLLLFSCRNDTNKTETNIQREWGCVDVSTLFTTTCTLHTRCSYISQSKSSRCAYT